MSSEPSAAGSPWSAHEVELVVADYFAMLRAELLGEKYVKADHRRRLMPLLNSRSRPSVEWKYENVSAVLIEMGYPYIDGYKPARNYQALLAGGVESFLATHPGFFGELAAGPTLNPAEAPRIIRLDQLFEEPPETIRAPVAAEEPWNARRQRRIDFVRRDAENRRLGKLGEEFVLHVESERLKQAGRDDLARRVEWVAETSGDGVGFDVLSFDERDSSERFIEVKTTGLGKFFPFYVTSNEVRCSEACSERFRLFRVFEFSKAPRLYVLRGALSTVCHLEPTQYRATI